MEYIDDGAFHFRCGQGPTHKLSNLYIEWSESLDSVSDFAFGQFHHLQTLRIRSCGLRSVPMWGNFTPGKSQALTVLDLQRNKISRILPYAFSNINGEIGDLILSENDIERIDDYAFAETKVSKLVLSDNPKLTELGEQAFARTSHLKKLDLSRTKIYKLPVTGLDRLNNLTLRSVYTLKIFPPVLRFLSVKDMHLTYPYHCCALKYPRKQNAELYQKFMEKVEKACKSSTSVPTTPMSSTDVPGFFAEDPLMAMDRDKVNPRVPRWLKAALRAAREHDPDTERLVLTAHEGVPDPFVSIKRVKKDVGSSREAIMLQAGLRRYRSISNTDRQYGFWGESDNNVSLPQMGTLPFGLDGRWLTSTIEATLHTSFANCGDFFQDNRTCTPEPDAFNPCEDVMGFMWLRVVIWLVVSTALLGNLVVLVVTSSCQCRLTVAKFLMCNLAFADLCLGAYLFLLAAYDLHTSGIYFAYAIAWQTEGGCQVAGFLSTFSICLSIFTLTVITLERWYAIRHAINLSKRLRMRQATLIMAAGWLYAIAMAILPLFGVSSYGKTSLCLPMDTDSPIDEAYVFILLLTNALAFLIILGCYVDMYLQVTNPGNTTAAGRNDANIAKRMAILVFTDFACLFPIAFFGITAALGYPMITVTESKILLVFFFPLNSCANPFLYAIFTKQFRKDLYGMINRCHMCDSTAARYRAVYTSQPISNSHSRTSQSVHAEVSCWVSLCPCCACFQNDASCFRHWQPVPDILQSRPRSAGKSLAVPSQPTNGMKLSNGSSTSYHINHSGSGGGGTSGGGGGPKDRSPVRVLPPTDKQVPFLKVTSVGGNPRGSKSPSTLPGGEGGLTWEDDIKNQESELLTATKTDCIDQEEGGGAGREGAGGTGAGGEWNHSQEKGIKLSPHSVRTEVSIVEQPRVSCSNGDTGNKSGATPNKISPEEEQPGTPDPKIKDDHQNLPEEQEGKSDFGKNMEVKYGNSSADNGEKEQLSLSGEKSNHNCSQENEKTPAVRINADRTADEQLEGIPLETTAETASKGTTRLPSTGGRQEGEGHIGSSKGAKNRGRPQQYSPGRGKIWYKVTKC